MPKGAPRFRPNNNTGQGVTPRRKSTERGYDGHWRKLRKAYLTEHPWCQCDECQEGKLRLRAATVVHHRIEIAQRPDLRLSWDNLQSMSKPCHDRHTGREHGFEHLPP